MDKTQFKISAKVSLPINQDKIKDANFIPKDIPFEDNKITLEQVAISLNYDLPVLLVGETGTGKTSLVRHLAAKTNHAFVRVNHSGGTSVEDILGRYTIDGTGTVWNDGILIKAMKEGLWYLADEINAASPEINFAYHSLLDDDKRVVLVEKGHEVVIPHKNFRFFGAMNPSTEYAGTKELNKALKSRFSIVNVDFVSPKVEAKIVSERAGIPLEVAERMVKVAAEVRASHAKQSTRFVMSTRDLIMWGQMFKVYGKYLAAAKTSILNKVSEDDENAIRDLMLLHFKTTDGVVASSSIEFKIGDEVKIVREDEGSTDATGLTGRVMSFGRNQSILGVAFKVKDIKNLAFAKVAHDLRGAIKDTSKELGYLFPIDSLTKVEELPF